MELGRGLPPPSEASPQESIAPAPPPQAALARRYAPARRIDARCKLVLPGLINGHTRAPMVLFREIGDNLPLQEWLGQYICPAEAKNVSDEFVTWGTRRAALEMIRSGT